MLLCLFITAVVANPVTLGLYWYDKQAAQRERTRIRERNLHLWALAGGWPAALYARRRWRHKTRKQPFVAFFWCTVGLNLAAWLAGLWWVWSR
jgi:uncharacterized membrane protein YsdA (DUF1294 family)